MATRYKGDFPHDSAGISTTNGLTRPQVLSDLAVGLSTCNKWVRKQRHENVERENERLHKQARLLREGTSSAYLL